jgi:hypothetical protein
LDSGPFEVCLRDRMDNLDFGLGNGEDIELSKYQLSPSLTNRRTYSLVYSIPHRQGIYRLVTDDFSAA